MSELYAHPEDVEAAFYRAFEAKDAQAMAGIWEDSEEIICIHPMGPPLSGRQAVIHGWREIFSGDAQMRLSLERVQIYRIENLAVHIVVEHIEVASGQRVSPILATNLFRLGAQGWRMLTHHASPMPSPGVGLHHPKLH